MSKDNPYLSPHLYDLVLCSYTKRNDSCLFVKRFNRQGKTLGSCYVLSYLDTKLADSGVRWQPWNSRIWESETQGLCANLHLFYPLLRWLWDRVPGPLEKTFPGLSFIKFDTFRMTDTTLMDGVVTSMSSICTKYLFTCTYTRLFWNKYFCSLFNLNRTPSIKWFGVLGVRVGVVRDWSWGWC